MALLDVLANSLNPRNQAASTVGAPIPNAPLNEEGMRLQGLLQDMGAFNLAGRGSSPQTEGHGVPNQRIEAQNAGFLSRLGRGAIDYLSDPINRKQLAIGFNAMRLNPDANLARSLQGQIETEQGMRLLRTQGNRTAEALERKADQISKTDPQRAAQLLTAAEFIRNNPTNTEGISAAANMLFTTSQYAPTVSGVQTDPNTGEQYVVITDRDTMQPKRMTVAGATQMTPAEEAALATQEAVKLQDIKFAQETGQAAMGQVKDLDDQITKMYGAYDALKKQGAQSGLFVNALPAFNAGTAQLRSIANQLGIDVINSATFGALSQEELRLALRTQLDLNLPEQELLKQIDAQIRAKDKLRAELIKMAQDLTSGVGYSDYIKKYQFVPLAPPEGVPLDIWRQASPSQKRELSAAAQQ